MCTTIPELGIFFIQYIFVTVLKFHTFVLLHDKLFKMEYLSGNKNIVFIGLNPVKEAIEAKAVFCIKSTFWEILQNAKIIDGYPNDLKNCANEIFNANEFSSLKLGFADLVPECGNKKSSEVKILPHHVPVLLGKIMDSNADKIVLLGHKVATAFIEALKINEQWEIFKNNKYTYTTKKGINKECFNYGLLAQCQYYNNKIFNLYVMPFPETVPIPNKHIFYRRIMD